MTPGLLRKALAQAVNEQDRADIIELVAEFRKLFSADPDGTRKLLETGDSAFDESLPAADLAAWTMAANVLLNRDDFINKN